VNVKLVLHIVMIGL